ncbi:uncharacterized protein LOC122320579 [Drosophila ficusphila]|uniref:uncharacterized protein LOC122320579 n=1 Tax=Drosophila ficusphila TaxID=30025 RepID=UPI001C892D1B|nr:uncharacterized protein LOC122320579 [Drosophila ficusphila]
MSEREMSSDEEVDGGPTAEMVTVELSSTEEDSGGETVTPVVSSDEDDDRRAAKARRSYRQLRRAVAGGDFIRCGTEAPSGDPAEVVAIMARRQWTLRKLQEQQRERVAGTTTVSAEGGPAEGITIAVVTAAASSADVGEVATTAARAAAATGVASGKEHAAAAARAAAVVAATAATTAEAAPSGVMS